MAKEPDQRYATTVELARAAHDATTVPLPRPAPTMPAHPPARRDHPTAGPIHLEDTQRAPTAPALLPQPPPGPPGPPQAPAGVGNRRLGRRRTVAIGLAAAVVLATSVAITAVVVRSNSAGKNSGAEVSTPGPTAPVSRNSPAPPASSTPPSANPGAAPMSLTGKWSGPVSGDQTGFDVVADIVDGAQLTGTVSYPQLNCAGIWTQHGSAGNGIRLITETTTQGTCVNSEVTLTPQNDGTLSFRSTYYAASQTTGHDHIRDHAPLGAVMAGSVDGDIDDRAFDVGAGPSKCHHSPEYPVSTHRCSYLPLAAPDSIGLPR